MYFVGTKSVYVLLCPLPGSVIYYMTNQKKKKKKSLISLLISDQVRLKQGCSDASLARDMCVQFKKKSRGAEKAC